MVSTFIAVILVFATMLSVVATVRVARSGFGTPLQKTLQVVFVWAIPLLGPLIAMTVLTTDRPAYRPRSDPPDASDTGLPATVYDRHQDGSSDDGYGGYGGHGGDGGHGGHGGH
jgi:hypothetical protein